MVISWDIKTIQSYIVNQVEENLSLDYKASDALQKTDGKKKDIAKDVSAMANAAGGTIIYGIKEFDDTDRRHLPEQISPVNRADISKEWLEQVINSNIQPKVEGIIITPVTINDENGTVVYVVEVPQGSTAHQASDKKYYKRYNFESVPMEDYEIRDIMSRLKHPDVKLEIILERKQRIEIDPISRKPKPPHINPLTKEVTQPKQWYEYTLKVTIFNKGKVFANYVNYHLQLPAEILHKDEDHLRNTEGRVGYKEFYAENTIRDVVDIKNIGFHSFNKYGPSRFDPVLPGTHSYSKTIQLKDDLDDWDKELYWTIYADNAEMKSGSINLSELVTKIKYVKE